jgi:geranylgeranyl reductase family protein
MTTLSVAVIGAGPAGATAARILASQGAQVTLLEARHLPRGKTCGGALTPKAQRLVPPSALDTVERRVHRVEIRGGRLPAFRLDEPAAEIAMVERSSFDYALTEAAAAAGAEIRDGERVDALTEDEQGVTITTRRGQVRVDLVVAADGDPSAAARHLGLGGPVARHSLALTIDLPLATTLPDDTAILSFTVPGGFAWYFPKGDHANIGVGSRRALTRSGEAVAALRRALSRFASGMDLDVTDGRITGHRVPQGLRCGRLASPRVLLAGDAAATVDPLFGEGISYAIVSGVVAAQTIADMEAGTIPDLRAYDDRLRGLFGPPLRRLEFAAAAAERSMTLALAAVRLSPWIRTYGVDVITGRRHPFAIGATMVRSHGPTSPNTTG